jgi:hypothetical protein
MAGPPRATAAQRSVRAWPRRAPASPPAGWGCRPTPTAHHPRPSAPPAGEKGPPSAAHCCSAPARGLCLEACTPPACAQTRGCALHCPAPPCRALRSCPGCPPAPPVRASPSPAPTAGACPLLGPAPSPAPPSCGPAACLAPWRYWHRPPPQLRAAAAPQWLQPPPHSHRLQASSRRLTSVHRHNKKGTSLMKNGKKSLPGRTPNGMVIERRPI